MYVNLFTVKLNSSVVPPRRNLKDLRTYFSQNSVNSNISNVKSRFIKYVFTMKVRIYGYNKFFGLRFTGNRESFFILVLVRRNFSNSRQWLLLVPDKVNVHCL